MLYNKNNLIDCQKTEMFFEEALRHCRVTHCKDCKFELYDSFNKLYYSSFVVFIFSNLNISTIIIGAICGFIAGKVMNVGAGLLVNIILGIAGGCVGGFLFRILGFAATSLVGTIISGVVGSILLIYIGKKFFK